MDQDRYLAMHQPTWSRLAHLVAVARRPRRLTPAQLDELVALYPVVATHLSQLRTAYGDPALTTRLTLLVAEAHGVVHGARTRPASALVTFFARTFPAAVWRLRRFVLVAALLTFVPALGVGAWLAVSDRAVEATAPEAVRTAYLEEDFEAYYSSEPAAQFATEVFVNNVRVAITAFALGILGCVVTAGLLAWNGANVGVAAGLFTAAGAWPRFWGLILPHGLLELSAVVVAGAAGLALGWALLVPGDRPRTRALADEGRRSVAVVLGLVAVFGVAALIEGFVTGSTLPTPARVGVGVAAASAFWAYVVVFGAAAPALRPGTSRPGGPGPT